MVGEGLQPPQREGLCSESAGAPSSLSFWLSWQQAVLDVDPGGTGSFYVSRNPACTRYAAASSWVCRGKPKRWAGSVAPQGQPIWCGSQSGHSRSLGTELLARCDKPSPAWAPRGVFQLLEPPGNLLTVLLVTQGAPAKTFSLPPSLAGQMSSFSIYSGRHSGWLYRARGLMRLMPHGQGGRG